MIIDGGFSAIGLESTIIDLSEGEPMILRPGYVTQEKMMQVIGNVDVDRTILDASSKEAPKAPGMKYRHYAPKGNLTIVEGPQEKVTACINEKLSEGHKQGLKTGVIATDETIEPVSYTHLDVYKRQRALWKGKTDFLFSFEQFRITIMHY